MAGSGQERLKEAPGSYGELHLLLYARGRAEDWSAADAARRLQDRTLEEALERLVCTGFLTQTRDGSAFSMGLRSRGNSS